MLNFLEGISPVWWVVAALALGAVEMVSTTTLLLWPALSALAVAGILALVPGLSGEAQASLFAVLGIVMTIAGRYTKLRFSSAKGTAEDLNDPAMRAVGQIAQVIDFDHGEGKVKVNGVRWHARCDPAEEPASGDSVKVTSVEGSTLIVERISDP